MAEDGTAVGTAQLDWDKIEPLARDYVAKKTAAGRYTTAADMTLPKPTWEIPSPKLPVDITDGLATTDQDVEGVQVSMRKHRRRPRPVLLGHHLFNVLPILVILAAAWMLFRPDIYRGARGGSLELS